MKTTIATLALTLAPAMATAGNAAKPWYFRSYPDGANSVQRATCVESPMSPADIVRAVDASGLTDKPKIIESTGGTVFVVAMNLRSVLKKPLVDSVMSGTVPGPLGLPERITPRIELYHRLATCQAALDKQAGRTKTVTPVDKKFE